MNCARSSTNTANLVALKSTAKSWAASTSEDLIEEEMMVVSITSNGYIKRTPVSHIALRVAAAKDVGAKPKRRSSATSFRGQHACLSVFHKQGKYTGAGLRLPQLLVTAGAVRW
jgi:DNA gyrase/topoisomerase IV subunit A